MNKKFQQSDLKSKRQTDEIADDGINCYQTMQTYFIEMQNGISYVIKENLTDSLIDQLIHGSTLKEELWYQCE